MPNLSWIYSVNGCTCRERFPPSNVSKKSKRIGNSVPNLACTLFPRRFTGSKKTILIAGEATLIPLKSYKTQFSSGTPSKDQA